MEIDIRTLSLIVALACVLEASALGYLYVYNKKYPGVAWWVLGSTVMATGYLGLLLRDGIPSLLIAIILPNVLIVSGSLMVYVGILRFLNKKENPGLVLSLLFLFTAAFLYFTYVIGDISVRTAIISVFLAVINVLMAWALSGKKIPKLEGSARFLAAILIIQGSFLVLRSVFVLTIVPVGSLFTPTRLQTATALIFFIFGFLFTIGLINLVNQRLNAEVTEAKEDFELIFHHSPVGVLVTRLDDGRIVDANEGFLRLTGFTRQEIIGSKTFEDQLWKNHGDHRLATEELKKIKKIEDFETVFHRKDTSGISCLLSARVVTLQETPHIIWVIRDITERKVAENALKEANKKLNLLSSITRHDITNQLTILSGYLDIMKRKQTDPALDDFFFRMSTAAQRISVMIQFTSEYESIGVNAPVWEDTRTLADTVATQVSLGKVMVKNDLPAGTEVFADPLVARVFYNLLDNAVRYGGKITTIRFSAENAGEDLRIVCEDDGDGVVNEEKEMIFERGFGKNTGFGLALSREILDITGIIIRETGEPGKGARFEMVVPKGAWRFAGMK